MNNSNHVQLLLDGTIQAIQSIVPMNSTIQPLTFMNETYNQQEIGVLIGLVGDIKGRIIIDSMESTFSELASNMFGMPLEGEMLNSFIGEFGNMLVGNICTHVGAKSIHIDITPPTVIVGNTKLYGFESAYKLPVIINDAKDLAIFITIDVNE